MNKKEAFSLLRTLSKRSPWIHPYLHTYWSDTGLWKLRLYNKTLWNKWSQHTRIYVDLRILSKVRTQEEFIPFPAMKPDIQVFLSLHRHYIFLLYILTFSQWLNRWHQQLSYQLLVMNEIYILKNNLSTTATSGHQIVYYKETII